MKPWHVHNLSLKYIKKGRVVMMMRKKVIQKMDNNNKDNKDKDQIKLNQVLVEPDLILVEEVEVYNPYNQ